MNALENGFFFIGIVFLLFVATTLIRLGYHKKQQLFIYTLFALSFDICIYHLTNNIVIFLSLLVFFVGFLSIYLILKDGESKVCRKKEQSCP